MGKPGQGIRVEVFGTRDKPLIRAIGALARQIAPVFTQYGTRHTECRINIIFVNNKYIAQLNRRFLGRKGPTDVISFPLNTVILPKRKGGKKILLIGEVYISRDQARIQSRTLGTTLRQELLLLTKHGILHLAGLSHQEMDRLD
ncbi:MAG: rRNA maturation RNase YbeY [candidate division WOR-3 bacterium]